MSDTIEQAIQEKDAFRWYVMICQRAEDLSSYIEDFNLHHPDEDRIDNYFIPAVTIKPRKPRDTEDIRSNQMRNTLRHFVFLHVRPSTFEELANERWNIDKTRLYHYRTGEGGEAVVSNAMMNRFMDACLEYGSRFDVITQPQDITDGMTVIVRDGAFKGLEARVMNIQFRGDGVRFSIAIKLFADNYAYVHDRQPSDVILQEKDASVFNSDYLERLQHDIISILYRKVNGKGTEEEKASDMKQLRDIYRLRHASVRGEVLSARFDALMSICASLTKNESGKSKYNKLLKRKIKEARGKEPDKATYTILSYLLAALFISTKDPAYRTEVKQIMQTHLSDDPSLRQLITLIRKV